MKAMGAKMPEAEMQPLVDAWRAANPNIVAFWSALDRAARTVIRKKTSVRVGKVTLYWQDDKMFMRLPSGRNLCYFKKRKLSEITARDVIDWQNEIRQHTKSSGESYSPDYLKNVHTQLSCIFNHAIKYYGLQINPAAKAGNMGSEQPKEMLFWTKEEYLKFIDAMMDKPMLYYAFEILYWCGIREGELLALTPADFDFKRKTLRINKSYQRLQGKDVITTPKTKKSNRVIQMPDFLCDEIQDYFKQLYGLEPDSRIFPLSKYALKRGMAFGCKVSGVKVIRIHDLRHSHVSLLINMGYSAVAIGNRVGHESVEITYRYAHLFPTVQKEMADKLNVERSN